MMKYLGNGFLIGVPARDLTKEEVEALGLAPDELVESGLYGKEVGRVKIVTEEAQKDGGPETEDGQGMSAPSEIDDLEIHDKEILQ